MGRLQPICFIVFLLAVSKAQDLVSSEDLKVGTPNEEEDESKSGAHAESFVNNDVGFAKGESFTDGNSGSSIAQSSASSSGVGSNSAKATAQSSVGSEQYINPYGLKELILPGLGLQGSSVNKVQADALALTNSINNIFEGLKPSVQLSPYGSGLSSQALAEAQAQTSNEGHVHNYHVLPSNYYSGTSSSQTEAQALQQIFEGLQNSIPLNPSYNGYQLPLNLNSLPGSSQAQAEAQAFSNADVSSYNPGLSIQIPEPSGNNLYQMGYPGNVKQNSVQASAEAQAALSSYNEIGYNQGMNGYQQKLPYSGHLKPSSSHASAEAQAVINGAGGGYNPRLNPYRPEYGPLIPGSSQAEAQAIANNGVDPYGSGIYLNKNPYLHQHDFNTAQTQAEALFSAYGSAVGLPYGHGQNTQASGGAQSLPGGQGSATANAQALSGGANAQGTNIVRPAGYSRVIPSHEHIMPHFTPGMEAIVVCTSEGEMYNVWLPPHECLVCACVSHTGILMPLCARCDGCNAPLEPFVVPEQEPTEITLRPPIPNEVTCSPLPSWQSFENPLNPCQICICKETLNNYGIMEAVIDCTVNPDCVVPTDTPLLPPITDEIPISLPLCEKFPKNVLFPHPMDACKLCKCEEDMTLQGFLEPKIICMPNPECSPESLIVPELKPAEDIIMPLPDRPFPDNVVTPEPLPWPPATSLTPIVPGPLPGPSPHESCRPFQPGTTFQHPWDECQTCVCTEARELGLITIEVNCFTKASCCYEVDAVTPVVPVVYHTTPSVQIIDKLCEFTTFGVQFIHPQDKCKVCTCELFGGMVKPSCKPSLMTECLFPYLPGSNSEIAEAQASAISQANVGPTYLPSTYSPIQPNQGTYDLNIRYPSLDPYNMGISNLQTKELEKIIQSPFINEPLNFNKYSGYSKPGLTTLPGYQSQPGYQGNLMYPLNQNSAGSVGSDAMANAYSDVIQHQSGLNLPGGYDQYKQILGYPVTGSAVTQTEALALDQKMYYPGYHVTDPFWTGTKGQKNVLTDYNKLYYPGMSSNQPGSSSEKGNTRPGGSGGGSYYQGIPGSNLYPYHYSKPSYGIAPSYYPGQFGFEEASAQARAQSLMQGLGPQGQGYGNIARLKTKSGEEDADSETAD